MKYSTKYPPKISNRICDYILISSPTESKELLKFIPNTIKQEGLYIKTKCNSRLFYLNSGLGTKLKAKLEAIVGKWKDYNQKDREIILAKQGIPIYFYYKPLILNSEGLYEDFRIMSANYTTLSEDYTTLENSISWDDFYS